MGIKSHEPLTEDQDQLSVDREEAGSMHVTTNARSPTVTSLLDWMIRASKAADDIYIYMYAYKYILLHIEKFLLVIDVEIAFRVRSRASRNNIKNGQFPGLLYYAMVGIHDINHIFPRGFPNFIAQFRQVIVR